MEFYKYHGAGNDFIMIDNLDGNISLSAGEIQSMCNRNIGIGADGVILMEKRDGMDCFMNYSNSDGTFVEMCGNGVRCITKFFLEQTKQNVNELLVGTRDGVKKIICHNDESFSVSMGIPIFFHADFPENPTIIQDILFKFVSMGNPHAVGFVKDVSKINLSEIGPKIENDSHFKNKINTEFVERIKDDYFKVKVWERGCGATLACGTGASAIYAILKKENTGLGKITLEFPGGKLLLSQDEEGKIILRGPAEFVYKGEWK